MTGTLAKVALLLFLWSAISLVLQRAFRAGGRLPGCGAAFGYAVGGAVVFASLGARGGEGLYAALRIVGAGWFLLLALWAALVAYRGVDVATEAASEVLPRRRLPALCMALLAGFTAGALSVAVMGRQPVAVVALLLVGVTVSCLAPVAQRRLPASLTVGRESLPLALVAGLLAMSALSPRLNLFTPLTMKVMKFIHDLVHQLFETLLVPDHPFFRVDVWGLIGLLFSRDVGFWGGLVIWFVPVALILIALGRSRLPSVAHIRQGARRRSLLAGYVRERNRRFLVPAGAGIVLGLSIYTSLNPMVEYWDPKPLAVTANPQGVIVIAKKAGELDLEDGRLHKFTYSQGGTNVRFFILMRPDAHLTAVLDACSICQPEGYGQGEGTVICYYCRTLIPIETVGQPGGCNPVPFPFSESPEAVTIDSRTLVTTWENTALAVGKGPGGGK